MKVTKSVTGEAISLVRGDFGSKSCNEYLLFFAEVSSILIRICSFKIAY